MPLISVATFVESNGMVCSFQPTAFAARTSPALMVAHCGDVVHIRFTSVLPLGAFEVSGVVGPIFAGALR
jgi:tRNA-binding EMAP/Myf-like protein